MQGSGRTNWKLPVPAEDDAARQSRGLLEREPVHRRDADPGGLAKSAEPESGLSRIEPRFRREALIRLPERPVEKVPVFLRDGWPDPIVAEDLAVNSLIFGLSRTADAML